MSSKSATGFWAARIPSFTAIRHGNAGLQPLVYAVKDGIILSCVLGRAENKDSLVIGFVACEEDFRGKGITKALMGYFGKRAREMGYKYITLGSKADGFYDSCGYKVIFEINGQNIYQKLLD